MKKNAVKTVIVVFVMLILAGCTFLRPVKVGKLSSFKINGISLQSVNLDITLPVENPNLFTINIQRVDLDIKVNNVEIGKVNQDQKLSIQARSNSNVKMNIDVKLKDLFNGALVLLQASSEKQVKVGVKGQVKAKMLMVSKTIDINQEENISL